MLRQRKSIVFLNDHNQKMNEHINWDHSLIKKYSSSNHFKLLNQLRNEVKKYPLSKKKNISSDHSNDNKFESKQNPIKPILQESSLINNNIINKETNTNKLTISFNNSKNFSIYKNIANDVVKEKHENNLLDAKQINEDSMSSTFNTRLNDIVIK